MASANLLLFLAIFLFSQQSVISAADFLAPLLSPYLDDICKDVVCGKGKCKASVNSTFDFNCDCDPGWKQTLREEDKHPGFLPCVIPNCTLNYSCTKAEAPAPATKEPRANESIFDPCFWAYCGEGSCIKSEKYSHRCECKLGHSNLLNVSSFPCFSDCALGVDCASLGITVSNDSATSPPNLADNGTNLASSISSGNFLWLSTLMTIIMMSVIMVPWR